MSKWNPTASPCPALLLGEAPWGYRPLAPSMPQVYLVLAEAIFRPAVESDFFFFLFKV